MWDIQRIGTEDLLPSSNGLPQSAAARDAKRVKTEPSASENRAPTGGGERGAADNEGGGGAAGDGDGSGVGPSECGVVLRGHSGPVYGLSFNPVDERMLLSCSGDATGGWAGDLLAQGAGCSRALSSEQ